MARLREKDLKAAIQDAGPTAGGLGYVYDGRAQFTTDESTPCATFCNLRRPKAIRHLCRNFYAGLSRTTTEQATTCPVGIRVAFRSLDEMFDSSCGVIVHTQAPPRDGIAGFAKSIARDVSRRERRALARDLRLTADWANPSLPELDPMLDRIEGAVRARWEELQADSLQAVLADHGEFVASFAHEALSPLQQIKLTVERASETVRVLATENVDAQEVLAQLQKAQGALQNLGTSLEGMRLLFNPTPETPANRQRVVDLRRVVADWVSVYETQLAAKNIELHYRPLYRHGSWNIQAVPEYLGVLVRNVVSNAVKYSFDASSFSGDSGKIVVNFNRAKNEFSVVNFGVLIPQEELRSGRLFERERRGANATDRGRHGKGVGLHLVKRVCDLHGWRIAVTSQAMNAKGPTQFARTEISIRLAPPRASPAKPADRSRSRRSSSRWR